VRLARTVAIKELFPSGCARHESTVTLEGITRRSVGAEQLALSFVRLKSLLTWIIHASYLCTISLMRTTPLTW
jgi:hypothetical protein